jgi:long-chain acyl-CoA synthetase
VNVKLSLIQGMQRAARLRPRGTAIVDGDVLLDWGQVENRVSRLASGLRSIGVADGDRVAVLASNSHRVFELFFATIWAGGVAAPLNNRLSSGELADQVRRAAPRALFYSPEFAASADTLLGVLPDLKLVALGQPSPTAVTSEGLIESSEPCAVSARQDDDMALLFFTGGTTGEPKGVMLSHANMLANSVNFIAEMQIDESCIHLHCGPLFHVASAARLFSVTQVAGGHVILPRFEPLQVLDAIEKHRVTVATFVPTMVRALLDAPELLRANTASLQYITYGAAPMPEQLLRELMNRLPHVRLVQSYGMTETSPIATLLGYRDHLDNGGPSRLRSAGRAALLADIAIVDSADQPVPTGSLGEVVIRGPMVMLGYWQNQAATDTALRGGWMHTGDIGHLDADGYLYVVDRIKDVIISGGENIYSQEVENVISAHPAVKACAVIGRPDEKWGEAVHAIVVPRAGMAVTSADILAHCRATLSTYKCPKSVEIRPTDLPLSGTNKVNKGMLRTEMLASLAVTADGREVTA